MTSLQVMVEHLLPTPQAHDAGSGKTPEQIASMRARGHGVANLNETVESLLPTPAVADVTGGHARRGGARGDELLLNGIATASPLLPTPRASDGEKGGPNQHGSSGDPMLPSAVNLLPTPRASRGASSSEIALALGGEVNYDGDGQGNIDMPPAFSTVSVAEYESLWAQLDDQSPFWVTSDGKNYWPAIRRWAAVIGRPAPAPSVPSGKGGRHRLNPRLVEWMMGQADEWITNPTIWEGMTASAARNAALKAGGNGVVTQQAYAALAGLWARVLEVARTMQEVNRDGDSEASSAGA